MCMNGSQSIFFCFYRSSNFVSPYFSLRLNEWFVSCPVLLIVIYPSERNCLRENLSFLVLACWIELLISSCFNLPWCTEKGRLVSLQDGSRCQGKMDLSDSLTSRKRYYFQVQQGRGFDGDHICLKPHPVQQTHIDHLYFNINWVTDSCTFILVPFRSVVLKWAVSSQDESLIGYALWWMVDEWLYCCMMLHWSLSCESVGDTAYLILFTSLKNFSNVKLDIW